MLPFTIETYFSTIVQYNLAIWPAPLLGMALALAALVLVGRTHAARARWIGMILLVGWLWAGVGFHLFQFSQINFAAPVYAGLFVMQAVLIGWLCVVRNALSFRFAANLPGAVALFLAVLALLIWPLVGFSAGAGLPAALVFGADPTATVLLTLALWLLACGPGLLWLSVVPVLWTFLDSATFLALGAPFGLVFPVLGLVVVPLLVLKRQAERSNGSGRE